MRLILSHFVLVVFVWPTFADESLPFEETFPEFAQLSIGARVEKKTSSKFDSLYSEQDKYYLSVSLEKLSKPQFDALRAQYGSRSQVPYQPERNYNLSDFLPPSMQAVIDQTFTPVSYSFEALNETEEYEHLLESDSGVDFWALKKNGLGIQTNCWNTTFENLNAILFDKTEYRIYVPARWTADGDVDLHSEKIKQQDIKLWDMLIVREKSVNDGEIAMLMHTAILINENVVFEKTDSSENDPYRLSLVEDVVAKYQEIFGDRLVVEYRRATQAFPEQPYLSDPIILSIIKKFHPEVNIDTIASGCETGMGGGCDMYHTSVVSTEIITYKKTGRGILRGPKSTLDRFSPL